MFHGIRPRAGEIATVAATIGDAGSSLINIAAVSEHPEGGVEVDPKPVLLVGESRAWRIIGDVHYATAFDRNIFEAQLADPPALMAYLHRSNISYVLINWVELERIRKTYQFESALSIDEMRTRVKQLESLGLEPIQGDRRFEIYRVGK